MTQLSGAGFSIYQTIPLLNGRLTQLLPTPQTSAIRALPPSVSSPTKMFGIFGTAPCPKLSLDTDSLYSSQIPCGFL